MTRRDEILDVCVELADREGFQNISLKTVADRLGVKSPSLYKHFPAGLSEIKESLMTYGWNLLDIKIAKAVVGKPLEDALKTICYAFRDFAHEHPGVFAAICWHNSYTSELNREITRGVISSLYAILDSLNFNDVEKMHILRCLRGFLEGFSMLELHGSFGDRVSLDDSFAYGVDAMIAGFLKGER